MKNSVTSGQLGKVVSSYSTSNLFSFYQNSGAIDPFKC